MLEWMYATLCVGRQPAGVVLSGGASGILGKVLKVLLLLLGACLVCSVGPLLLASTVNGRTVIHIVGPVPA